MIFPTVISNWLRRHRATLLASMLSASIGLAISLLAAQVLHRPVEFPAAVAPSRAPVIAEEEAPAPVPPPPPLPPEPIRLPTPAPTRPAWRAFAVPAMAKPPMIAVIIDDMGLDRRRSDRIVALPPPLTISFMTYANHLSEQTRAAHDGGHELMMHVPMQPLSATHDAGLDVLRDDLPKDELRLRIDRDLDRFTGYVGVNNHMGSRFTADPAGMKIVMEALHKRGLLFIDSLTTGKSVGLASAKQAGVPAASRDVFLDDVDDEAAVRAQLAKAEDDARRTGNAIAIGHPRDNTIAALAAWLPGLAERGIALVPVSSIVLLRQHSGSAQD